jgi:hypothetical protein
MKNKLLLTLTIVVGILIVVVIVKSYIKRDIKKNYPIAYDLIYGTSSNSETKGVTIKAEVKPDSTDYWRANNFPPGIIVMFRTDTLGEGALFMGAPGEKTKEVCPINWKKTGELVLISYSYEGISETQVFTYYNVNTLITIKGDMKLVRVQKK